MRCTITKLRRRIGLVGLAWSALIVNSLVWLSPEPSNDPLPTFLHQRKGKENYEPAEYGGGSAPGDNGVAYTLSEEHREEEQRLSDIYGFNQLVSDKISLNRTVPDLREEECRSWDYPTNLPTASVILVVHNEGWSTLLRTVHSVINRSPPRLLHEVILVDDHSDPIHFHEQLETRLTEPYYHKVRVIRNQEREGLIRSRNYGAVAASGDVVVFLDAHCEVNYNWLPPLLAPILADRTTLTVPLIDTIEWKDFSIVPVYKKKSHFIGIFEWGLLYKETLLPQNEDKKRVHHSEPYNSPTNAGGLFAIDRSWFEELGWYDPELHIWGGENYELSLKIWMCGGRLVWVPCSRVGHVYRGHKCSSCHSDDIKAKFKTTNTALRNYKRVVETWFSDEFKEYFYTREPLARYIDMGDITPQLRMISEKKCKSFDWFMKEVGYEILEKYPRLPPNKFWGQLVNEGTQLCLDTLQRAPPHPIGLYQCQAQLFRLNSAGQLTSGEWCIDATDGNHANLVVCATVDGPWEHDEESRRLLHRRLNKCLSAHREEGQFGAMMTDCESNNVNQRWTWKISLPSWAKEQ